MKPSCDLHVPQRGYGRPGPCQSKRAVQRVQLGDTPIMACVAHRKFILGGGKPTLARRDR